MPSETDLYFRVADNAAELPHLRHGRLVPILGDYPLAGDSAIWAVYPNVRLLPVRVRLFIDFLGKRFGQPIPCWDAASTAEG